MESRTSDSWPWIAIAVVFGVGIMAIFAAFAMPFGGYYGMMGGAGWVWGGLMMAAVAVILFVIVFALVGALRQPNASIAYAAYPPAPRSASEVLEERYVRGELTREDYLRIRGDLGGRSSQP